MKPVLKDIQDRCQNLWKNVQLAETLHVKLENSTIDILISNDDYLNLILPERREIQKVVYLFASRFGCILTGRTQRPYYEDEEQDDNRWDFISHRILPLQCG